MSIVIGPHATGRQNVAEAPVMRKSKRPKASSAAWSMVIMTTPPDA